VCLIYMHASTLIPQLVRQTLNTTNYKLFPKVIYIFSFLFPVTPPSSRIFYSFWIEIDFMFSLLLWEFVPMKFLPCRQKLMIPIAVVTPYTHIHVYCWTCPINFKLEGFGHGVCVWIAISNLLSTAYLISLNTFPCSILVLTLDQGY